MSMIYEKREKRQRKDTRQERDERKRGKEERQERNDGQEEQRPTMFISTRSCHAGSFPATAFVFLEASPTAIWTYVGRLTRERHRSA
jgi:hypothetical protein